MNIRTLSDAELFLDQIRELILFFLLILLLFLRLLAFLSCSSVSLSIHPPFRFLSHLSSPLLFQEPFSLSPSPSHLLPLTAVWVSSLSPHLCPPFHLPLLPQLLHLSLASPRTLFLFFHFLFFLFPSLRRLRETDQNV